MIYNPDKDVIGLNHDIIRAAKENANQRMSLSHYTNVDALEHIVNESTLRFNRIDKVNDQKEKLYLKDAENYQRIFVSCFTHRNSEYIPHWYMYGKDERGIRITFVRKIESENWHSCFLDVNKPLSLNEYKSASIIEKISDHGWINWDIAKVTRDVCPSINQIWSFELSTTDIIYGESNLEHSPSVISTIDSLDLVTAATIKSDAWRFEEETRMIAIARSVNTCKIIEADFLLLPIQWDNFEHIVLTLSPWITESNRKKVTRLCKGKFPDGYYDIQNSAFEGAIRK